MSRKYSVEFPFLLSGDLKKRQNFQFIYINTAVYVCMGENIFCLRVQHSDLNGDGLFFLVVVV